MTQFFNYLNFIYGVSMFRGKSLFNKFLLAVPVIAVSLPALAVDEIIVTAERIEANLQEVPMAVTALSAADLETNNIK